MNYEKITDKEWFTLASENECFDFLSDDSEDIYSKDDGVKIEPNDMT